MSLLSTILQTAEAVEEDCHRSQCLALSPQLRDLTERARTLTCVLRDHLVETHVRYASHSSNILECTRRATNIRSEYVQIIAEAKVVACKDSPGDHSEELKNCINDLEQAYEFLSQLCCVVEATSSISRAGVEFQRSDAASAVSRLNEVMKSLNALKLEGEENIAVGNIRQFAVSQRALYITRLSCEWEEMLSWCERTGASHITYSLLVHQGDTPRLHSLLHSLYRIDRLHDKLSSFADFFIDKIVKRIVNNTCDIYTDENVDTIIFSIKFQREEDRRPSFQSIFTNLTAVLEFLQSAMGVTFSDSATVISVLSQLISDRFFNVLISDCVKSYLPDCDGSYQLYKQLTAELDSFNKILIDMKFVTKDESPIDKYLKDANAIMYKKKCDRLLSRARELLSECMLYRSSVVSGEGGEGDVSLLNVTELGRDVVNRPLMLPRCVVSDSVRSLVSLLSSHLSDGGKQPLEYSSQLLRCVSDIVVMYQTVVPNLYEDGLKDDPLVIALFVNNSFYLSHSLLGSPWCSSLPPVLADALNMALAPSLTDLRTLGLHHLARYLRRQRNAILASVKPEEQIAWTFDTFTEFSKTIRSSLKIMKRLKRIWLDVIASTLYDKSMSTLVEALCTSCLTKILTSKSDYVEEEMVVSLAVEIESLADEMEQLYKDAVDLSSLVPTWKKFRETPQILRAQMLELSRLWNTSDGVTAQLFGCEEIRHVVKIRFPDDVHRLKVLSAIQ